MDCDGALTNFDIDPFVLALVDPGAYALNFPGCDRQFGDVNLSGSFTNFDIDSFVNLITSGQPAPYYPVLLWVEGVAVSSASGDITIHAEADDDGDGTLNASDDVKVTVVSISPSSTSASLGSQIIWTLQPTFSGFGFNASSSAA